MADKGSIKEVFPGGNTYKGFHSFFDYIISQDEANRIFSIKGGPGVGKSSFMKAIAKEFVEMGCDVELHHCSSDNNSLDAVVIKQAKVALLDGTAPHIVDPKNPGAVDEVLNFGDFWRLEGFEPNRDAIVNLNKDIKATFNSAYHYLVAAKEMQDDMETIAEEAVDKVKFNKLMLDLKAEFTGNLEVSGKAGRERHLFDSANTPNGLVDYIETIIKDSYKCYLLKGLHTKGISEILNMLAKEYVLKGYNVEVYHQPLNPERLQTLLIEDLGIAFTVNSKMEKRATRIIDLDEVIIQEKLESKRELLDKDATMKAAMIAEAHRRINMAKKKHDELEKYYVPNIDFAAINEFRKKIIERIKKYL